MNIEGSTDLAHIAQVQALPDPVLRNLWITQTYHYLAAALAPRMKGNATWLSFAVWASRTVGKTIRNEEIPTFLLDALTESEVLQKRLQPPPWLKRLGIARFVQRHGLIHLIEEAMRVMSDWLARGNTLVFAELAPIYSQMFELFPPEAPLDREAFNRFLEAARIEGTTEETAAVRRAFTNYYLAQHEPDQRRCAQLVLAGNLEAVLHEQKRLQPHISGSMNATLEVFARGLLLTRFGKLVHLTIGRFIPAIDRAVKELAAEVVRIWDRALTEFLMELQTPDGPSLDLGEDVPALPGKRLFPALLSDIEHEELRDLLARWDHTGGSGVGSAARDWRELADRMNYVANLFRSRQLEQNLLKPPFLHGQVTTMRQGRVPEGSL